VQALERDRHYEIAGALDLDQTPDGVVPRRLPGWTRHQLVDPSLGLVVTMSAGVRLRLETDATRLELDVLITGLEVEGLAVAPPCFDLVVDGEVTGTATPPSGRLVLRLGTTEVEVVPGEPTTVAFDGLPGRPGSLVEVWLPHSGVVELRAVRVPEGSSARIPNPHGQPVWVHHGSSISHCVEAPRPTGCWPVVAARLAGVQLQSMGFAGQCMLDQFSARTIRDLPADLISLKVGINLLNGDTMRERVFVPALHGFLDTVRDGHPTTPLLLVTPILCPAVETAPGPTVLGPDLRFHAVPRPEELALGALTLERVRQLIALVVESRVAAGDSNLHLLSGLELFGEQDLDDLPDGLHPNGAGYQRMGERFYEKALAPGQVLSGQRGRG
jgi:lysophospholipase L1-like esterase